MYETKHEKDIEDEIDINKDTISGVEAKIKEIHDQVINARQNTNIAYQEYIETLLRKVAGEYMKIAPKLSELICDFIVLEDLRDGDGYHDTCFTPENIKCLPSFSKSSNALFYNDNYEIVQAHTARVLKKYKNALFYNDNYEIVQAHTARVLKKYNVPKYYVARVRLSEYQH